MGKRVSAASPCNCPPLTAQCPLRGPPFLSLTELAVWYEKARLELLAAEAEAEVSDQCDDFRLPCPPAGMTRPNFFGPEDMRRWQARPRMPLQSFPMASMDGVPLTPFYPIATWDQSECTRPESELGPVRGHQQRHAEAVLRRRGEDPSQLGAVPRDTTAPSLQSRLLEQPIATLIPPQQGL